MNFTHSTETCSRCDEPMAKHDNSPRCRYQGWKNYETWAVNLWLSNDEPSYRTCTDLARITKRNAPAASQVAEGIWTVEQAARYTLADALRSTVDAMLPELGATMAADLLGSAVQEVDWNEIADAWLEASE